LISVLIPTFNEEENILRTLKRVENIFKKLKIIFEIIIIDEKSTDKTCAIIKNYNNRIKIIISKKKLGLGYALEQGMAKSKKKFILFLDADNSVENKYLYKLIQASGRNKLIIGSRYLKDSDIIGVSLLKSILSKILNKFISIFFKLNVSDSSHSLRIFPKNLFYKVKNYNHPIFFWEHTIHAKNNKMKIVEIPIKFVERKVGKSKNSFFKMTKNIILSTMQIINLKKNQIIMHHSKSLY
jgi:dolichol-phosphate mannosyltransferase